MLAPPSVLSLQQALAMADPSEPKYCHCQRISFGEMIACENPGGWAAAGVDAAGALNGEQMTDPAAALAKPSTMPHCCTFPGADCPYEWFHFGCVGLTEENRPKGGWRAGREAGLLLVYLCRPLPGRGSLHGEGRPSTAAGRPVTALQQSRPPPPLPACLQASGTASCAGSSSNSSEAAPLAA